MASSPPCQFDDQKAAVFVGTFFENGLSVTVCEDHFISFLASSLESLTDAPITQLLANAEAAALASLGVDVEAETEHSEVFALEHDTEHTGEAIGDTNLDEHDALETDSSAGEPAEPETPSPDVTQ